MSRTERIHAIDDFIKRHGKVTKQRLVDYLEVSKESIKKISINEFIKKYSFGKYITTYS